MQDQIDIAPQVKVNLGYRLDDYKRAIDREGGLPFTPVRRDQMAHSYRAGIVYAPRFDQQIYFATATSFTPVNTVPADGSQLEPSTGRSYEVGHRWQGWNGRVDTTAAGYYTVRNNVTVQESVISFIQVGEQNSKGLDVDVNTDLGGADLARLQLWLLDAAVRGRGRLDRQVPRFVPRHNVNLWLRKDWAGGFNAALRCPLARRAVRRQREYPAWWTATRSFPARSGIARPRWEWSLNAENLFNNDDYFLPGHFGNNAFPGQPINVTTTFRLLWN